MGNWKQTLREMVAGYDSKINAAESQIASLRTKTYEAQQEVTALNNVMYSQKNSVLGIANDKRIYYETILGGVCTVHEASGFGETQLNNWYVYWHGDNVSGIPGKVVFKPGGVGDEGLDATLICLFKEFVFFQDYINVDINLSLYSLNGLLNLLDSAEAKLDELIHKYSTAKRRIEQFLNQGVSGCILNPLGGDFNL